MRLKILFFVFLTIVLFNFCSTKPKVKTEPGEQSERKEVSKETIPLKKVETDKVTAKEAAAIKKTIETAPAGDVFQAGIASWYGADFHGKRTANGEIYDMYKLTAAHKTLPFHTLLEVENLDNKKRIVVRINDRGPFLKDRILDLSYKAAQKLGCDADGVAPVRLRIVKPGTVMETTAKIRREDITETEAAAETTETSTVTEEVPGATYYLQAGAFSVEENARKMLRNIKYILPDEPFNIDFQDGLYKVISGSLPSRARAEELKKILLDIDIDAFIKEQ
jgi:rare lipoprotein A